MPPEEMIYHFKTIGKGCTWGISIFFEAIEKIIDRSEIVSNNDYLLVFIEENLFLQINCANSTTRKKNFLSKEIQFIQLALKSVSSRRLRNFSWQVGYGAFSVNPYEADIIIRYIENQQEHHLKKSFQQEFLQFLMKYRIEFNEQYLWD